MLKWVWVVIATACVGCHDYSITSDDVVCDENNECIVCTDSDCSSSVTITMPEPPPFRDVCEGTNTTNLLVGTCWWEQCRDGEKSLFPKIAGTPCIFKGGGNSPWIEGVCDDNGSCN